MVLSYQSFWFLLKDLMLVKTWVSHWRELRHQGQERRAPPSRPGAWQSSGGALSLRYLPNPLLRQARSPHVSGPRCRLRGALLGRDTPGLGWRPVAGVRNSSGCCGALTRRLLGTAGAESGGLAASPGQPRRWDTEAGFGRDRHRSPPGTAESLMIPHPAAAA